jgi:hypothetical protein
MFFFIILNILFCFHLTGFNITLEIIFLNWRDERNYKTKTEFIAFIFYSYYNIICYLFYFYIFIFISV